MVRKVVDAALNQPLLVLLVTAMFIAGGILAFRALPVGRALMPGFRAH